MTQQFVIESRRKLDYERRKLVEEIAENIHSNKLLTDPIEVEKMVKLKKEQAAKEKNKDLMMMDPK